MSPLAMTGIATDCLISAIVALFLLVYLGWAMFKPERF